MSLEKYKNRHSGNRDAVWTSVDDPQTAAPAKSPQSTTKMPDINEPIPHSELVDLEALNARFKPRLQSAFVKPYSEPLANGGSGYFNNLAVVESAGKWDALNKGSGAYGRFQFMPKTEKSYAKKLGISIEEARTPAGQMAMVSAFTNDNRKGLQRAGFEPTQKNLYMAHQQGLGGAIKMLNGGQAKSINLTSNGVSNTDEWLAKFGHRFS